MTGRKQRLPLDFSIAEIVSTLEGEIIFGRMSPEQELIEDGLMERFDAKRHVIRSALQELIQRGLVDKQRSYSARVKSFKPAEVNEIYQMRALLHCEAVRIMPLPAAAVDTVVLREIHVAYETAVESGEDPLVIHQLNNAFHQALMGLCRNALLCELIIMMNLRSAPIRSHGIVQPAWLAQACLEHSKMIAAVEAGDRETLSQLVVDHMMPTRRIWEEAHSGRK